MKSIRHENNHLIFYIILQKYTKFSIVRLNEYYIIIVIVINYYVIIYYIMTNDMYVKFSRTQ